MATFIMEGDAEFQPAVHKNKGVSFLCIQVYRSSEFYPETPREKELLQDG